MRIIYTFIFLFITISLHAQLSGKITNSEGEALPFANIYVHGTTNGTTSNLDGIYNFEIAPGTYKIVYQYVGYKPKVVEITVGTKHQEINVVLDEESVALETIVIKADGEDPAYAIIRQAIKKRSF